MFEQAFKRIDDVLRNEAGCTTELDYTEQTSWLLFLKYLDGLEQDLADQAELEGRTYTYILEEPYRWGAWAAPKDESGNLDHNIALTGDRPGGGTGVLRAAPSYLASTATHAKPAEIVAQLLRRLGDPRYVHRIEVGPPPPLTLEHLKGWFTGERPPADALWAYIAAPAAVAALPPHASAVAGRASELAQWETGLVEGALRDEFCAAGGRPLVGWSVSGRTEGVSDHGQALGQRFPNPTVAAFRARAAAVGRRYGFRIGSLRLLHPLQLAPLLIVKTSRDRKAFVHDVPAIMRLLDPIRSTRGRAAVTFDGFFFEADDSRGPFVRVENVYRGETMGGEWSWNPCVYPYPHSEPVTVPGRRGC